jgi:hypothetical protein
MKKEQQVAIAYSTKDKTFAITSVEIAQAMLFMGNEYGFNRATTCSQSGVVNMREVFEKNGFRMI